MMKKAWWEKNSLYGKWTFVETPEDPGEDFYTRYVGLLWLNVTPLTGERFRIGIGDACGEISRYHEKTVFYGKDNNGLEWAKFEAEKIAKLVYRQMLEAI